MMDLLKIRREERPLSLFLLAVILLSNALAVYKYYDVIANTHKWFTWKFFKYYHMSGFDPITYSVISSWTPEYKVYRHPLLALFMYPLYMVNSWLTELTGVNCAQFAVLPLMVFCAFYSFVFINRIFTDIVKLGYRDSALLTVMTYSSAYMMLCTVVPDHFVFSLFALTLTLLLAGRAMEKGQRIGLRHSVCLFVVTAGITVTNGVKVFVALLFVNGRRFFRPRFMLLAVLIPVLFLLGMSEYQQRNFVIPRENAQRVAQARKDSIDRAKAISSNRPLRERPVRKSVNGRPIARIPLIEWTDVTTPRGKTVVENLFGEPIQFHRDHFLGDIWVSRPIFVEYNYWWQYAVEAVVVLLFIGGIWSGRHSRCLWLALSWFGLDMIMHLVLGFTINEIYIMSPHWLFIMTLATGFLVKKHHSRWLTLPLAGITVYLLVYNGLLLGSCLLHPVAVR